MGAKALENARINMDDEFYTDIQEVEDMLAPNLDSLKGKKILLPCDCKESAFCQYLTQHAPEGSKIYARSYMDEGGWDMTAPMADEAYDWCDVVITNPPFSLLSKTIYPDIVIKRKLSTLMIIPTVALGYSSVMSMIAEGNAAVVKSVKHNYLRPDGSKKHIGTVWLATYGAVNMFKSQLPELDIPTLYEEANMRMTDEGIPEFNRIANVDPTTCPDTIAVPISGLEKHLSKWFRVMGGARLHINGSPLFQRVVLNRI